MLAARRSAALGTGLALVAALAALGAPARGDVASTPLPDARLSRDPSQARTAEATWALEGAFADQFVRNEIDPAALSASIDEAIRAMPEAIRAQAQQRIDEVLRSGQAVASMMSSEERASLASPPAPEAVDSAERALIRRWGWDGYRGWGGEGAFAFPGLGTVGSASSDDSGDPPRCRGFDPQCAVIPPSLCIVMTRCHLVR
jgi:hypothetical protein